MRTHALLKANARRGRGINAVSFYQRGDQIYSKEFLESMNKNTKIGTIRQGREAGFFVKVSRIYFQSDIRCILCMYYLL